MIALQKAKQFGKRARKLPRKAYDQYKAPLPKWAKWTRNILLGIAIVGGNIASAGTLFPATVITIASYTTFGASTLAAFVQAFRE